MYLSGLGSGLLVEYICIDFSISARALVLDVSLTHERYQLYDTNHIVDSVASIVITTISSTRVKAFIVCFCIFIIFIV
jgi:hypothetical protein